MDGRDICTNCGRENPPGSKFCVFCGSRVTHQPYNQNVCPHCGNALTEGAKFCNACGNQIGPQLPPRNQQEPVPTGLFHDQAFGSNVPPQYDQIPAEPYAQPPDMTGYYPEQRQRKKKEWPKKEKREKAPREAESGFNAIFIPIILFIIAVISAFILTWQITVLIAIIAIVSLYYVRKRNADNNRYEWMGY